jgi:hypothetical protein
VKALRKPSAAAGAVNRVVRSHRTQVGAFLDAAARLRDAQLAGKGDLGAVAQAERVALEELVGLGGEPVRASLQAAAVDDEIARGTLLVHAEAAKKAKSGSKRSPGPAGQDDSAARAGLQEAKKLLRAAEAEERQAQQHWAKTQRELEQARAPVENAQRKLDRLREKL